MYSNCTESEYIGMSQSKAKYHRLHLDEVTDGTSYEKHTSNKASIVNCSKAAPVLVLVLALSLFLIIVIVSKSDGKEGRYMQHCYGLCSVLLLAIIVHDCESRKTKCFARHILQTFMHRLSYMVGDAYKIISFADSISYLLPRKSD